jgi:hypothetical protein
MSEEDALRSLVVLAATETDLTRREIGAEIGKSAAWVNQQVNQAMVEE